MPRPIRLDTKGVVMTREINGVAYCSDYEELVGPIPDGKVEAKVIKAEHQTKPSSKTSAQTK